MVFTHSPQIRITLIGYFIEYHHFRVCKDNFGPVYIQRKKEQQKTTIKRNLQVKNKTCFEILNVEIHKLKYQTKIIFGICE